MHGTSGVCVMRDSQKSLLQLNFCHFIYFILYLVKIIFHVLQMEATKATWGRPRWNQTTPPQPWRNWFGELFTSEKRKAYFAAGEGCLKHSGRLPMAGFQPTCMLEENELSYTHTVRPSWAGVFSTVGDIISASSSVLFADNMDTFIFLKKMWNEHQLSIRAAFKWII